MGKACPQAQSLGLFCAFSSKECQDEPIDSLMLPLVISTVNGRDVAEAGIQQNDAQDLLVEKLPIGAGSIN